MDPTRLDELADRIDALFQGCKDATRASATVTMSLIELRNLAPETVDALRAAARDAREFAGIERLPLGPSTR